MSESPKTAAAAPYTPSGAAASERMLSSVLGRVHGPFGTPIGRALHFADRLVSGIVEGAGPGPERGPAQRLFAQPVSGGLDAPAKGEAAPTGRPVRERSVPTQDLLTAAPRRGADLRLPRLLRPTMAISAPERMFGTGSKTASPTPAASAAPGERPESVQPVLQNGWEAGAALPVGKSPEAPASLWGTQPRPTLEPLVAAVEADMRRVETPPEQPATELPPGNAARPQPRPASAMTEAQAHEMAVESSKRLMDAMRAHAMANSGSDDRISLGDMTLIAFAESNNQMAAAASFTSNAPQPQPIDKALGEMAHPKIKEDQQDLHNKLRAMAKLVREDLKQVQKLSKERFGAHG